MTDRRNQERVEQNDPLQLSDLNFAEKLNESGAFIRQTKPLDPRLNAKGNERQPSDNRARFPEERGRDPWWPTDTPQKQDPARPSRLDREDRPGGWGVHWFDDKDLPLPPRPPEPPPKPNPDTRNDGKITIPDSIQPPVMEDPYARRSVNFNADARALYLTGGLTGAAVYGGTHAMDIRTGRVAPEARTGMDAFWRDHLSPSQRAVPGLKANLNHIDTNVLPQAEIQANATTRTFARETQFRSELVTRLASETPKGPIPPLESDFFKARVDLIKNDAHFTRANLIANAGTAEQVAARQRLFTTFEAEQLATQADNFWAASQARTGAAANLTLAQEGRHRALALVTQAERGSISTASEALLKGAGRGLAVTTGLVATDYMLDSILGNNPDLSNGAHWGLQGLGMPLLLASRASMPAKIIGSIGMVAGSHVLDKTAGPPLGAFSPLARPSLPEVGLATMGALTPAADWRVRAGLAVGGYMLGKSWNYLDDKFEITGKTDLRLQSETAAAIDTEFKSPSYRNFTFAAQEMKKFSDRNEPAAALMIKDWAVDRQGALAIEKDRTIAALMLGHAESMLERGTRVDQDKFDKNGARMLAGKNYDFGGAAANYFNATIANLTEAEKLARANKGRSVTGATINDQYINDLVQIRRESKMSLDKIYDAHDMPAILEEVKANVKSYNSEMRKFGESLKEYVQVVNNNDPRYKAKLMRDLALLHIAYGELETTAGAKSDHYRNALKHLDQSRLLDSSAPDLIALRRLLNR